jgi:hypothetical protein
MKNPLLKKNKYFLKKINILRINNNGFFISNMVAKILQWKKILLLKKKD